jgi:hypothetical protein
LLTRISSADTTLLVDVIAAALMDVRADTLAITALALVMAAVLTDVAADTASTRTTSVDTVVARRPNADTSIDASAELIAETDASTATICTFSADTDADTAATRVVRLLRSVCADAMATAFWVANVETAATRPSSSDTVFSMLPRLKTLSAETVV